MARYTDPKNPPVVGVGQRAVWHKKSASGAQAHWEVVRSRFRTQLPSWVEQETPAVVAVEHLPDFRFALVPAPSYPDLSQSFGMLAWREWRVVDGRLFSSFGDVAWSSFMCTDVIPQEDNYSGLHAHALFPDCLSIEDYGSQVRQGVGGLVELFGKVQLHGDGWVRAEFAKVLCVSAAIPREVSGCTVDRWCVDVASVSEWCRIAGVHFSWHTPHQQSLLRYQATQLNVQRGYDRNG